MRGPRAGSSRARRSGTFISPGKPGALVRPVPTLLLLALLTLAGCSAPGGDPGPEEPSLQPSSDASSGEEPLQVSDFSGVAAGVGSCDNLLVHAARQPEPVEIPDNASAARLEVVYDAAGPGGLNELAV